MTKSREFLRIGKQTPTHLVEPDYVSSDWETCHAINAAGGLKMLEWQDNIMRGWLGTNSLGRWSAQTCGGTVARQNGKTIGLVVTRCNYGMIVLGEEIIYTSHLQKTSTETFEYIANFFDSEPLKKYVKDIKTALGRESVILKNGARIKFLARTRNGGRGQHGDLLIFDEALELDADSQASFLPAISASANPQTIYISTPPTPKSDYGVFREIRKRALDGDSSRTAWFEYSTDDIGDTADKTRWYDTNPSLGILIQESTIEAEHEQMDAETFARERLGYWSKLDKNIETCIEPSDWNACVNKNPKKEGLVCYGVKFSPDGLVGSLAACYKPSDGLPFVYVVDVRQMSNGLSWFADTLARVHKDAAQIVIDGQSNAQALTDKLIAMGVPSRTIIRPRTGDVIAACSWLVNAVKEHQITHFNQEGLNVSATRSKKRRIGNNGGFGFGSTEEAEASLIESAALAYWGVMTTKRNPNRKAVIL